MFLRTQVKERIVLGGRFDMAKAGLEYMKENVLMINCQNQECLGYIFCDPDHLSRDCLSVFP